MAILNAMFRNGENSLLSTQWEFLDSPPARSWRNMLEHTLENPKDDPLSVTESVFCNSATEAKNLWSSIRTSLGSLNHGYARLPFSKLKSSHAERVLNEMLKLVQNGNVRNLDQSYEIRNVVENLKKVLFYFDHVRFGARSKSNEDSAFGYIMHTPDPHFYTVFRDEWREYLTLDIEPGTLYAELAYPGKPWYTILEYDDIANAYGSIRNKEFAGPSHMGSGFLVPFHPDVGEYQSDLIEYFFKNLGALKQLDPSFDPIIALKTSGRLPVAKLKSSLGGIGEPGYHELLNIENMFKLEVYESY